MSRLLRGEKLGRSVLAIVLTLMFSAAGLTLAPQAALADAGDNYPWKTASFPSSPSDTWGYAERWCTSWTAWALHDRNGFEMPYAIGNANVWASVLGSSPYNYTVNGTPAVGAIAQYDGHSWNNGYGHVAWVLQVNSSSSIVVLEYNWNLDGTYTPSPQTVTTTSSQPWPDHFIHVKDINPTPLPSTPAAVSRSSTSIDLFYNDGNNHIMNYWWDTNGWHSGYWSDNKIAGQPTVIDRTSNNLDVFYRTTDGKLEYRAWTASNGWLGVYTMVSSGVAGDPWALARGSNDMQIFYMNTSNQLASISWDINSGWNTTPQILYSGETTDPVAVSSSSSKMDVFFGKNNGNLVHMGWDPTNGWLTSDFSAGNGVDGRPTAITRNGANDFSAYYKELNSGKVAEEAWDINNGWSWQDWNASLSGSPSAITGVVDTIDNFYRETGGNMVDRYFYTCGWCTTNIVNSGGSTGNPTAIARGGTSIEVFYWDGTSLMDNNWNTGSQSWNGGAKIN